MPKVVLVNCESYDYDQVKGSVQKGINLLGGPSAFAKPGEKILLKPNWVVAVPPEKCVTTHPAVFRAVCEVFNDTGVNLTYGDSPSYQSPEVAAQKTGFAEVAAKLGIPMADFRNGKEIFFQEALQNKKFTIANGVLECDGLISLPKLKTHGFLKLTGSVKNQFGCVPGLLKGEFHAKLPNPADFAKMLVDLNSFIKPRLYIMDGIIAMEGNGPMSGDPRKMNVLLFSADPIALDATVCRIINVNPEFSYTITYGKEAGLGTYQENEIELLGESIKTFQAPDFKVNRDLQKNFSGRGKVARLINNAIVSKPNISKNKCLKCGVCVNMCPVNPKAVDWHNKSDKSNPPSYKYNLCIRCYCCQEVCPEGAIELKKPFIRKLFSKHKWNG